MQHGQQIVKDCNGQQSDKHGLHEEQCLDYHAEYHVSNQLAQTRQ